MIALFSVGATMQNRKVYRYSRCAESAKMDFHRKKVNSKISLVPATSVRSSAPPNIPHKSKIMLCGMRGIVCISLRRCANILRVGIIDACMHRACIRPKKKFTIDFGFFSHFIWTRFIRIRIRTQKAKELYVMHAISRDPFHFSVCPSHV